MNLWMTSITNNVDDMSIQLVLKMKDATYGKCWQGKFLTYGGQSSSRAKNKLRTWPLNEAAVTHANKYSNWVFYLINK